MMKSVSLSFPICTMAPMDSPASTIPLQFMDKAAVSIKYIFNSNP